MSTSVQPTKVEHIFAVDSEFIVNACQTLTMDRYAKEPPVSFFALAQPMVTSLWIQWRMTQQPEPVAFAVRRLGMVDLWRCWESINPYADGRMRTPDSGSYHPLLVTDDGGLVCEQCVMKPEVPLHEGGPADGWQIQQWITSGDLEELDVCSVCDRTFPEHQTDKYGLPTT